MWAEVDEVFDLIGWFSCFSWEHVGSSFTKLFKEKETCFAFWCPLLISVCQNIEIWCWFWPLITPNADNSCSLKAVGRGKSEKKPFYTLSILPFAFQPVCLDCVGTVSHLVEE